MTVWLSEQISGIISSPLYNTLYSVTLRSNKKPRLNAAAANVCHHIGFHCTAACFSPPRGALRIPFEVIFDVTFSGGTWHFDQIDKKKRSSDSRVQSKCKHNLSTLVIHPPSLSSEFLWAMPYSIYISSCLSRCETSACKRHYSPSLPLADFPAPSANRGETKKQPRRRTSRDSVGDKCNGVIMKNGQQSRPHPLTVRHHGLYSVNRWERLFFLWEALSVRGIVAGLAAGIYRRRFTEGLFFFFRGGKGMKPVWKHRLTQLCTPFGLVKGSIWGLGDKVSLYSAARSQQNKADPSDLNPYLMKCLPTIPSFCPHFPSLVACAERISVQLVI